jgi:hypothetical protein
MHTVDLLDEAIALAGQLGYRVRQEWLDGGGGDCEIRGQKFVFLDLAAGPLDQLELMLEVLRRDRAAASLATSQGLRSLLGARRAA